MTAHTLNTGLPIYCSIFGLVTWEKLAHSCGGISGDGGGHFVITWVWTFVSRFWNSDDVALKRMTVSTVRISRVVQISWEFLSWCSAGFRTSVFVFGRPGLWKSKTEPVKGPQVENEGSDTNVPETSVSTSRTLGPNDTLSSAKGEASSDQPKQDLPKKSFVSLFKDNRNPSKGITLYKVENQDDVVELEEEEVHDVIKTWGYALVGYVVGGFPGTLMPVWFTLLELPVNLWAEKALAKIYSKIGEPLCTDAMTEKRERVSYAQTLIEVDVTKELATEVYIKLPNGNSREQFVIYENVPKFCSFCKMLGHSIDGCKKKEQEVTGGTERRGSKSGMAMKEPHKKNIASVTQNYPPDGQDPGTAKGKEGNKVGNKEAPGDSIKDKEQGRQPTQNPTIGLAATGVNTNEKDEEVLETTPTKEGDPPTAAIPKKSLHWHDFMTCYVDLGLVDINSTGTFFTWTNNQTWSKIERAMCNQVWFSEGLYANARFLLSGFISDHSSCLVSLFEEPKIHKLSFMFFNMWCEDDLFLGLVETEVEKILEGFEQEPLWAYFSKSEAAKLELKQKQEELHDNLHDEQLKEMVRELQYKARFLVDAEWRFYAQKAQCEFLLEAKRNAKRNSIAALTKEDGSTTSSLEEIQEELTRFYGDLLGTKNEVQGFDATIMNEGPKEAILDLTGFSKGNMRFRYLGVPLSGVYLKVVDFAPLLNKVSSTLLTWAGLNLSYAGRLEVISFVVQGIESFWLGILPISAAVLDIIKACVEDSSGVATQLGLLSTLCA
ncbi:hypothetical protein M9H77_11318 [Catharanthus roseus]|uniref:Uncharacterized protein n=1 Tax=Catharanthus roseus TaxID=4058 RepID=A0ACC0BE62_CATRO|nr:hypothetical protein M9H77_11318 [Catharanthus roseus]